MSEEKKKKSKRTSGDGEDIEKKKKKKERDPLDWEDDKFPKMAERGVVPALIDQEKLREMQQQAKKQYISSLGPDPAKVQRTWKYHFGISALENVTQSEWEVFIAVSETGNKFDQFKNRLHGTFQYTRGYKVKPNIRKKFKRLEQVYSKEHTFSYKQMQNHFVTMDLWSVSKLQFNNLLGTAKRSFYDLANDNVYQTVGIKAAGQPQQNKGAADEDKRGFQIGNIFVQCLCSEVMRFDIALNNWQFLPKPELADNSSKKKLRLGIPTGPKKSNDTFETEPCEPPVYSWARGGMFVYKGTKESLNNEVLTIEVLKEQQGSFQSQGKALVGLRGAIDYPIAVGVVKTLTTKAKEYVQGRAGGSISMAFRSIALKPGQNDEDSSIPRPMQDLNSLTMYYLQADQQHLVVIANSADGLPVADPDYGSSNPFVRVKYDGTVESSPVVMASLTPIWNHIFYLPVRFTDPCIYKDPAYKKNVFAEEMRSKGFLELEIWHWDGVPTEFLGSYKLDLVKVRYGQQIDRAICNAATKTRKVADSNEADEDQKKEDTGDATVGIDPALAKVHSTYLYEGKREKISGSSLTTQATPTISFECYFLPDFKPDFKFPEQDDKEIASAQTFAPAYTRWNNIFKELNEAYEVWFPDSPAKRRWLCSFNDKSGKTLPLPRLITPLALPAELGSPLSIMHWIKCVEFSAPARQRACGQINEWQTPNDMLALRRGSVQDHAVLLCCALQGLKKDAWVCIGRVESGAEHAWVLTREGYGTITFWEVTTGAKYHLAQRWIGKTDERSVPEVDKRWQEKQATADWKSEKALEDRANFSRQQHLASMDQLYRLPIAPWPELYKADTITDVPFASIEVVFNGYNVYGNLLNHHPSCIYFDMEIDKHSWEPLAGAELAALKQEMYIGKDVAIPVGPKVSAHTAETLERNIENELKESIRMIRMRIGFESAYEDSEVRDEALRAYLLHLEKECVLDVDWAYDEADQAIKPWGAPSPFNASEYKTSCREAWASHWKEKNTLKTARQYLAVKENHVLSGVPLHFSSTDLKEIRKCIMGCMPIQEYFRYPSDDIFFFAVAKVIPLPQSVCSVWVFMGAEVKMSRERIMQLSKEQKEREAALFAEENGEDFVDEEEEEFEPPEEMKKEPPPPDVKDDGQDLYGSADADKKLEELQADTSEKDTDKKKKDKKKKDKESE